MEMLPTWVASTQQQKHPQPAIISKDSVSTTSSC